MRAAAALIATALALAATAPTAGAEEILARLSQTRVAITTGFSGSDIFIYGTVKRDRPIPPDAAQVDVLIAVTGPSLPVIVRKKEQRVGIWINGEEVRIDSAPSFYAVATTRAFRDVISYTEDMRHQVGLDYAVRLIGETDDEVYPEAYRLALVRLRREQGLYVEIPGGVSIDDDTLFSTSVALPAQLIEGDYRVRVLLLRDREVIDTFESQINVGKVGLERWIYNLAQENGLVYGLLSLAVALAAGWLASTAFRILLP